ncbi:MAG TPA: hypothetical protein PKW33_10050 [Anaerolineaceae bacterium]|nr:hypothetical protein [Anaerolineaceae bacterium]HPN51917.1 hypothetical protein [Anaerolineaceae bacterium]
MIFSQPVLHLLCGRIGIVNLIRQSQIFIQVSVFFHPHQPAVIEQAGFKRSGQPVAYFLD